MRISSRMGAGLAAAATIATGLFTAVTGVSGAAPAAAASRAAAASLPAAASRPSAAAAVGNGCQLGNGISHVVQLTFDNVHFFRDNPSVASDLEQMPALKGFIQSNGTLLSNNHTPLIAHTANDSLTNYSGMYGDRHGVGISNSYHSYNSVNGHKTNTDTDGAFTYWTDKISDETSPPSPGADLATPNEVYSAKVPATGTPPTSTPPAPWVPYTRAGCNVGEFSVANMVQENTTDIGQVYGANSPEAMQLAADPSSYKDPETAQYIGVAVHCSSGASLCANAQGVKYGQSAPSATASPDKLPDEPGGYNGFQALFGNRYVAPQVATGAVNSTTAGGGYHADGANSYQVTNSAGNLVDLNGNEIDNSYAHSAGFPGFSPTASQSLAYVADMQEAGIPITYGYISDAHEKKSGQTGCTSPGTFTGNAAGPGDPCLEATLASYNQAFTSFFARLAADGITKQNTLFVIAPDEGDHFAGANTGRAVQPTCTPSATFPNVTCSYTQTQLGELQTDLPALLKLEKGNTTPFDFEPQAGAIYANGQPGANDPVVRQLERDAGMISATNPYSGVTNEPIANYLADPTEERILHYVTADPARTPTFTLFPKPDYYFTGGTGCTAATTGPPGSCVTINNRYAYNHGYYAPEINNTWLGLVGPGVAAKGIDGPGASAGPSSAGPNSGNGTVPAASTQGTWADHTDIRPTTLALAGLKDDYIGDGRVLTEDLAPAAVSAAANDPGFGPLAVCYKQLNSSVGTFGTDTLQADTAAVRSGTAAGTDTQYQGFQTTLSTLADRRDRLATRIKNDLAAAEFTNTPLPRAGAQLAGCNRQLAAAAALPGVTQPPTGLPEAPVAVLLPGAALALLAGVLVWRFRRRHPAA